MPVAAHDWMEKQTNHPLMNILGLGGSILFGLAALAAIWVFVRNAGNRTSVQPDSQDAELDEELQETFPASDAVAHY